MKSLCELGRIFGVVRSHQLFAKCGIWLSSLIVVTSVLEDVVDEL